MRLDPDTHGHTTSSDLLRAGRGDLAGAALALRRATVLAPGLVAAQRELAAVAKRQQDWSSGRRRANGGARLESRATHGPGRTAGGDAHRSSPAAGGITDDA